MSYLIEGKRIMTMNHFNRLVLLTSIDQFHHSLTAELNRGKRLTKTSPPSSHIAKMFMLSNEEALTTTVQTQNKMFKL